MFKALKRLEETVKKIKGSGAIPYPEGTGWAPNFCYSYLIYIFLSVVYKPWLNQLKVKKIKLKKKFVIAQQEKKNYNIKFYLEESVTGPRTKIFKPVFSIKRIDQSNYVDLERVSPIIFTLKT